MAIPSAHAFPPSRFTFPDNFIFFNPCSGENVQFVGETSGHVAFGIQNDIAHLQFHVKQRDDGTGLTSGARYKVNAEQNLSLNVKLVNGTGEANAVLNAQVIGQGKVPNFSIKSTFHITINANGTVTVLRSEFSTACHG